MMMDDDDGMMEEEEVDESENDNENIDEEYIISMEQEASSLRPKSAEDEYRYEVLSAEDIVHFMTDIIKEVNNVVQVLFFLLLCLIDSTFSQYQLLFHLIENRFLQELFD